MLLPGHAMMRFQWNALRVGHRVLVHDATSPTFALMAGVVAMVDTGTPSNDIGVRVQSGGTSHIVRPVRLSVHLDPRDLSEACWRCDSGVATS